MTEIAATNTTPPPPLLPYGHDRLVCNVAQSVAAHLVALYPKDDNNNTSNNKTTTDDDDDDDFLLQECHHLFQDEIQNVIQERFHSSSSSQINPDVVMSLAFEKAIQIYKEKRNQRSNQSTKPNKSSFSLFGNTNTNNSSSASGASGSSLSLLLLSGGGGGGSFLLGSIITWERVQEECNTELEKIKMLQTVKYLEDIFPDWKDFVRPFLQGLMIAQTETKHSNNDNNNNNDDELIDQWIQLHRSWFRLARSGGSDESYHSFQFDLVENLMQMIDNNNNNNPVVQEENSSSAMQIEDDNHNHNHHDRKQQQSTQRIISTIVDMFSDWVERNELSIMTNHSERLVTVGTFLLQQSNMVVQYDPQAIWFHQWMLIMSCDQTTNVVLRSSSTTTIIISKHLASLLLLLPQQQQQQDESSTTTTINNNNNNNNDDITISPLAIYTLSIVRSILISTRLSRFPWTVLMTVEPNHDHNIATQGPLDLIRLYICVMETILFPSSSSKNNDSQEVNSTSDNVQQATIDMCLEAIDTLLWGCCCQNIDDNDDSSSSPFPNMLYATEQLLLKTNKTKNSALVLYTQQQLQSILHRIKQQ